MSAMGFFASAANPYRLQDVIGTVREWTRSLYGIYPYLVDDKEIKKREKLRADQNKPRVLRGGSNQISKIRTLEIK